MKKIYYSILSIVLACAFTACQDSSLLTVDDLKCELLESPLAIDNTSPHFSWKMTGKLEGLGLMLVGIILLLTALFVYNAAYKN